ncbi:hypothetical protein CL653_02560 [bacterium]|nr:hypothetical protein [bacterium]
MSKSVQHHKPYEKRLILGLLYKTIAKADKDNSTEVLLKNLLTESEQLRIGRRLLISQMILAGRSQAEVSELLSVSPNTFARTRKWLDGEIPQYTNALKEYERSKKSPQRKRVPSDIGSLPDLDLLRRKYPGHFLLLNLAEDILNRNK